MPSASSRSRISGTARAAAGVFTVIRTSSLPATFAERAVLLSVAMIFNELADDPAEIAVRGGVNGQAALKSNLVS